MSISANAFVILGASGDLAERKLVPALAELFKNGEFDESCRIIGSGRTLYTDEQFRAKFTLPDDFRKLLHYHQGTDGLRNFCENLGKFEQYTVFMALPPQVYAATAEQLYREGFGSDSRIIIEKPFGTDYESAHLLNNDLHRFYDESQIFRIDHYLAKEAVQNILVFRFANSLFYPVWNSGYIESIQINAIEDLTIGSRAQYFDQSGIIRDMVQNHLLQMLALLTMEAPVSLFPEDIQSQKINLLKAIEFCDARKYQYEGYTNEKGVANDSLTETYAELKLEINNYRWTGMPVYIRTGKALHRKGIEIAVRFKNLPRLLFNTNNQLAQNTIVFTIQPSPSIGIGLSAKIPGSNEIRISGTNLTFCYHKTFDVEIPEAYCKLLLDALKGDRTLFVSGPETEIAWQKIAPILAPVKPEIYRPGSEPPQRAGYDWIEFDQFTGLCSD
ncbi:MAG: glucose-6-phosphate dehydrogenase [Spirochaetales bacterium]|nr:glucose-6-phosphate dehydrogenase [Spirochaetales bacterium]